MTITTPIVRRGARRALSGIESPATTPSAPRWGYPRASRFCPKTKTTPRPRAARLEEGAMCSRTSRRVREEAPPTTSSTMGSGGRRTVPNEKKKRVRRVRRVRARPRVSPRDHPRVVRFFRAGRGDEGCPIRAHSVRGGKRGGARGVQARHALAVARKLSAERSGTNGASVARARGGARGAKRRNVARMTRRYRTGFVT